MTEQEAIQASIEHWKENKAGIIKYADVGADSCALCDKYMTISGRDCPCPLAEPSNSQCCCKEWRACHDALTDIRTRHIRVTRKRWERVCDAMIDRLESLLEKP